MWKNQHRKKCWIGVLEFILCAGYPKFDVGLFVAILNHPYFILFGKKMCDDDLTGLPLSSNICGFVPACLVGWMKMMMKGADHLS